MPTTLSDQAVQIIEDNRTRLFDVINLLRTVAKATQDLDNDTHGSMEIACREVQDVIDDLVQAGRGLKQVSGR